MHHLNSADRRIPLFFVILALLSVALIAAGCGGHTKAVAVAPTPTPTPTPTATTAAQVRFGDAPADQILAFEVSIVSPITVSLDSGAKTTIDFGSKSNRLELSHMAGKFEPFMTLNLPQGTYKGLELTLADPAVTYVKTSWYKGDFFGSSGELVSQDFPGNQTVNFTFDPPLVVGSEVSVFNVDFNIAKTLIFNPNDDHEITGIAFTPNTFAFSTKPVGPADNQQHQNGELEDVVGTVASLNGGSILLNDGQSGAVLTINTDASTKLHDSLDNVVALADMLGRVVEVEGYTSADSTMMATEVELLAGKTGANTEGVILDAGNSFNTRNLLSLGHQGNSFSILAQDTTGNGAQIGDVGWTFTVHTDYLNELSYEVDAGKCDWGSLQVPGPLFPFDSRHLFPGQRVMVQTSSALPDGDFTHFTATGVELAQQAVTGRILAYHTPDNNESAMLGLPYDDAGTWILLKLEHDSFVSALSGRDTVLIYQGVGTDLEFLPENTDKTIGEGSIVRVRGLLFMPFGGFNFSPGIESFGHGAPPLTMIARRITEQAQPICPSSETSCNY